MQSLALQVITLTALKAAVFHVLNTAALSDGHVYLDAEHVLPQVKGMLEQSQREDIPFEIISKACIEMREESKICGEETRLYLPSLYFSEVGIASKILGLIERNEKATHFSKDEIRKAVGETEEFLKVTYAETQARAIEQALNSAVMILTGGQEPEKQRLYAVSLKCMQSYTDYHLIQRNMHKKKSRSPLFYVHRLDGQQNVYLNRRSFPAMTIHRLLGFTGQEKDEETEREVSGKLIIVDEMSMVDTWLAHQLLKALHEDVQVVFVGDQDQLPPVGPGQVLKDLLASKQIPTVELTDVYRQAEGSTIIELAHQIKRGTIPQNLTAKTSDRSFIKASSEQVANVVTQVVKGAVTKGQEIRNIQVLAPMYKGPAGIDNLNKMIQELVNPNDTGTRKELVFGDVIYRIKDKVLQLVNQPESNVFNGDMGEVISIIKAKETIEKQDLLVVSFDGIEVTYQRSDLNQITLAYCCSIHKSQGSEFQTVIMPVVRGYSKMLRRNLLYTGITRAKNFLILCGEPDVLANGLQRTDDLQRFTSLRARLNPMDMPEDVVAVVETQPTVVENTVLAMHLSVETMPHVHPMIGMDGISPYDFMDKAK